MKEINLLNTLQTVSRIYDNFNAEIYILTARAFR